MPFNSIATNLQSGGPNLAGYSFTQASGQPSPVFVQATIIVSGLVNVGNGISGSVGVLGSVSVSGVVHEQGAANVNIGQVALSGLANQIVSSRTTRRDVLITNMTTFDTWIGQSGVNSGNGALLVGVKGASLDVEFNGSLYGVVLSGNAGAVSYLETYD